MLRKTMRILPVALCALLAACAPLSEPQPEPLTQLGVLPGSIGVLVERKAAGVVVSALKQDGPAASAGVRAGDVIVRYNGALVADPREFNRLVIDSQPGSTARVEVLRDGHMRQVEVPVRELDTMPRV